MIEKLGKRKYVLPLGIIIAVACIFSLIFYPMANMEMKNLPFAIVCLDEGVETNEGDVNLGNLVVNKITESTAEEGEESPIQWTCLSSQEELEQAMSNNEFYGAMVIPRSFSRKSSSRQRRRKPNSCRRTSRLRRMNARSSKPNWRRSRPTQCQATPSKRASTSLLARSRSSPPR